MQLNYKIINWVLHFSWNNCVTAHHYRVMAMSQTFVYYSLGKTSDLCYDLDMDKSSSYVRFKVIAESIDGSLMDESNEIEVLSSNIESFKITALNWYSGTTLAFRSEWVYDLYKIYDKNLLIAETEDPVLTLPFKIAKNKLNGITVEWYKKTDNKYTLLWVSDGFVKLPERKKSDYKISVVIPVYNAQIFLPRTLDSILSSSMSEIEIILVDDWSEDNSLSICNWYAEHFSCVSVIQQPNQWVCIARNVGISLAKWEYLGLVDNDDIVHPLMYESLYNACKVNNVDISIAVTIIRNDIGHKELCLNMPWKNEKTLIYTYKELIKNIWTQDNIYFIAVWNKIVKLDVAKNVSFPVDYPNNIVLYEDDAYTPTLYSYIDKFAICRDAYYIWDKRKQKTIGTASTMHKGEPSEDIWKSYIYACSYPIYYRCEKHKELSDYACFKHLIESYDKFTTPSPLLNYWNEKLRELINKQKLYENNLIMHDDHLKNIVNKLKNQLEIYSVVDD